MALHDNKNMNCRRSSAGAKAGAFINFSWPQSVNCPTDLGQV